MRGMRAQKAPKKTPKNPTVKYADDAKSIDELIQLLHHHHRTQKDQTLMIPGGKDSPGLATDTYALALRLSWRGHMVNWANCILAGKMVEGTVDRTPKKLRA
jgi:hypothetical protein